MSTPSDMFANFQADTAQTWLDFIKTELALCLTFSNIAARKYDSGNPESAEKSMAYAERAYETMIQFVSDPKHSKHFTGEENQQITAELERVRERLDGLIRKFRK